MMQCPRCKAMLRRFNSPSTGDPLLMCTACGWTQDEETRRAAEPKPPPGVVMLVLGWLFTLALVFGPYAGLCAAFPKMPVWAHGFYWLLMAAYIVFCATTTVSYDDSNLGLFGTMINNPFSFEDDLNRMALYLSILSVPGKIAWATMEGSWRWFKFRARGDGV